MFLRAVLIVQILIGMICGVLTLDALYFEKPYRDFDATVSRMQRDMDAAIAPTVDPHRYLKEAVLSSLVSVREKGIAIAYLQLASSAALIVLPTAIFLVILKAPAPHRR